MASQENFDKNALKVLKHHFGAFWVVFQLQFSVDPCLNPRSTPRCGINGEQGALTPPPNIDLYEANLSPSILGFGGKILAAAPRKFATEGAVLDFFGKFSKKWPDAIRETLATKIGFKIFSKYPFRISRKWVLGFIKFFPLNQGRSNGGHKGARAPQYQIGGHKWPCSPN